MISEKPLNTGARRKAEAGRNPLWLFVAVTVSVMAYSMTCWGAPAAGVPFKRGMGLWPSDYSKAYLDAGFAILKQNAEIVYVQIEDPFDRAENQTKNRVLGDWITRAGQAGLLKYLALEPFNGDRSAVRTPAGWKKPDARLASPKWQAAYRARVADLVRRYMPDYVNVAVEYNMYYQRHPEEGDAFWQLFSALRNDIKAANPKAKVFCSYQFETLAGRFAGRKSSPQWELLDQKGMEQDLIGVSSYPAFLTTPYDPAAIPTDYFAALKRAKKPLFFGEIGWYSASGVSPSSSADLQAAFVRRLPELLAGLNVEAVCWVNMADLKDLPALAPLKKSLPQLFSLGLLDSSWNPKPALTEWRNLGQAGAVPAAPSGPVAAIPQAATSGKNLPLDTFVALGKTKSFSNEAGAYVWSYGFSKSPLTMLVNPSVRLEADGLRLRLISDNDTNVAVVIEEKSGERYEYRLRLSAQQARAYEIPWNSFGFQADSKRGDGRFDVASAEKLVLLDLSGFVGKKGNNRLRIEEIACVTLPAQPK